jgi:phospholipase C
VSGPDDLRLPEELRGKSLTRRQVMRYCGMVGAGAFLTESAASWMAGPSWGRLISKAAATRAHGSDLGAIEHIVFLMMENRSYDHYFGAYPRGRGFDDHPKHRLGVFAQTYPGSGGAGLFPKNKLLPFHLDSRKGFECTDDLTHDWGPMHECWNHGKMNSWVKVHTSSNYEGPRGALTMGYYERADLPFHWALADHFTLCDAYHCSILGPTHPNRLMANSGTIDPAGKHGGPVVHTNDAPDNQWNCTWTTMQEVLQDAGVSWKVYSPSNAGVSGKYAQLAKYPTWSPHFYNPITNPEILGVTDHVLPYFTAFRKITSPLYKKAFEETFPNDFVADIRAGKLPSVSWIIPPLGFDEHPASSSANGQYFTSLVLDALVSNERVWSKTMLVLMYDENDGWFDHVPPPTPPAGTAGEYLTNKSFPSGEPSPDTLGIKGPLGLGVRVPCVVISPFSRGGHIATEVFDHTSQLKLVAKRFGVNVPNVSAWRRNTVGDLTSTLFRSKKETAVPKLPKTAIYFPANGPCKAASQDTDSSSLGASASVPTKQRMPNQQGGSTPASHYYHPTREAREIPEDHQTAIGGRGKATTKSKHNALTKI